MQETGSIYLIERADPTDNIDIYKVRGIEAFEHLSKSLFVTYDRLPKDKMSLISAILKETAVYRLKIPWSMDRLTDVIEAVILSE